MFIYKRYEPQTLIRILVLILVGLLLLMVLSAPAPAVASDNVTEAFDNYTANFTATMAALTAAIESHSNNLAENQSDIFQDAIGFMLVIGLTALAYWRRITMLYVLSGLALLTYGFGYYTTSLLMSVIIILLAISSFVMAAWDRAR